MDYAMEVLRKRRNLTLVHLRSSYRNGSFIISETRYPVEKVNRRNIRYNEVFDYRISHLNIVTADRLAYGCYEVYVLECDDDHEELIKYRQKIATSTFADLKTKLDSVSDDLAGVLRYIESKEFENY